MATDMAKIIDTDSRKTVSIKDEAVMDVEYPVQFAYTSEPVLCLTGTLSVIRPGRQDLALSDAEWRDLELLRLSESQESPLPEDVADGE